MHAADVSCFIVSDDPLQRVFSQLPFRLTYFTIESLLTSLWGSVKSYRNMSYLYYPETQLVTLYKYSYILNIHLQSSHLRTYSDHCHFNIRIVFILPLPWRYCIGLTIQFLRFF